MEVKSKRSRKEDDRRYRDKHRETRKLTWREYQNKYHLKRAYGLSYDEYEKILENQGGKCAMCFATKDVAGRKFSVDHSHETGAIRALLCMNCNLLLGHAKDNIEVLERAIIYLNKHAK